MGTSNSVIEPGALGTSIYELLIKAREDVITAAMFEHQAFTDLYAAACAFGDGHITAATLIKAVGDHRRMYVIMTAARADELRLCGQWTEAIEQDAEAASWKPLGCCGSMIDPTIGTASGGACICPSKASS